MATPREVLARTLTYIEEHRQEPLSLEALTEVSGLSRFQLIRLFSRVTGMTPMGYVRARRLAGSIPQLLRGDRILDIALDWGFEYEQSYIRAFRDAYHLTPARFRRQEQPIPLVEAPRLEGFTVSASGMVGRPTVLARPGFGLSGRVRLYNYADNLLDGTPLTEGLRTCAEPIYLAACRPHPRRQFTHAYLVATATTEASAIPRSEWRYPAGVWARFQYIGLHALDAEGVRRMRLMAALVVATWMRERHSHWDEEFVERVERSWLGADYCEVELTIPLGAFPPGP